MHWLLDRLKKAYFELLYRRLRYQRKKIGCKMTINQLMNWWVSSHNLIRFGPESEKEKYWTGLGGYGTLAEKMAGSVKW